MIGMGRVISVDNKTCESVEVEKYLSNPEIYSNSTTVIEIPASEKVYPIINRNEFMANKPGIYINSAMYFCNEPDENDTQYDKSNIIDFRDSSNVKDIIEKSNKVRDLEREMLINNSDNITVTKYDPKDSPEMTGLKYAINAKRCDINLYSSKFNGNFANDIRILNEHSITLAKLKKYCNALDMKLTMQISDKDDDVVNPMGKTIFIDSTSRQEGDNNE